jgi:hypothetical protein
VKVYISGPITGIPDSNRVLFAEAGQNLMGYGFEPVNPLEIPKDHPGECIGDEVERITRDGRKVPDYSHRYGCYMRADLVALLWCEGILLLPGWELSRGAALEESVARTLGLKRMVYKRLLEGAYVVGVE